VSELFFRISAAAIHSRKRILFHRRKAHSWGKFAENMLAFNLENGTLTWKYPQVGVAHSTGGTMTTAGGLLFFGDDAQSLEAVDARDGKPLWHFNTGQDMSASPMSYAVNGRQYVAIAVGSDIFSFTLPQ